MERACALAALVAVAAATQADFNIPRDKCGIAMGINEDDRTELFIQGSDKGFYHKYEVPDNDSRGWSNWISLGGNFRGGPSIVRSADGRLEVFGRGSDNCIWHKVQSEANSVAWTQWQTLGRTEFSSSPVAILSSEGFVHVFAKGKDNSLMHKTQFSNNTLFVWTEWTSLGGSLTSQPAVSVDAEGLIHVFVRGPDRALWHKAQVGGQQPRYLKWAEWETLGGVLASSPRVPVALNTVNLLDVYVRASDKAFWHRSQVASVPTASERMVDWKEWRSLGGVFASGPGSAVNGDGLIEAFGRGSDKAIWHKRQIVEDGTLTWSPWASLRGITSTGPQVRVRQDGMIDIFTRGVDKQIWYKGQEVVFNATGSNGVTADFGVWRHLDGSVLSEAFSC